MRIILVLALIGLSLAHPDHSDSWEEFKEKFEKQYESEEEDTYRSTVWGDNIELIRGHNQAARSGEHTFELGENQFADMTTDEITAYFNGLLVDNSSPSGELFQSDIDILDMPMSVDWRTKNNTVTPVKDQKRCGSCWAFSATGSLEGAHGIKTGKLVSLSEQNLVDCAKKEGNHGCEGGLMDLAFKYVKDNRGIDTEASYPYTAKDGKTCMYNASNSGATLTSWVDIPQGSEMDLQKASATVGPISVAIDASRPTFHFYKKGVYHDKKCSSERLDHGVLVVGYGTESSRAMHKDFWIVKNSWNTTWGMEGYIKMARNDKNNCGIATSASYPVV